MQVSVHQGSSSFLDLPPHFRVVKIYLKVPQNRYFNDPRPKPEGHRRLSGFRLFSEMFPVHMPKVHYRGVHLTRQDLSFLTILGFFDKSCLFQQILLFSTTFSTNIVFFNKSCCFQQVLSFSTRSKKTNLVEKDESCRKRQILSKKTILVEKDKSCRVR